MPTDGHGRNSRQNFDKYLFFVDVYGRERTLTEFGMVPWPDLDCVLNVLIYIDYFYKGCGHTNEYTNNLVMGAYLPFSVYLLW